MRFHAGLETLYQAHRDAGLTVLGFPCDQFGHQEPGSEEEIRAFCSTKYDVSFPLHTKIEVNGANAHPLYRWLKGEKPGVFGTEGIKWNFTKFLVGRDGQVIRRYAPTDTPAGIEKDILRAWRRRAEIAGFSTPPCRATSAAPVGIERDGGKVHIPELGRARSTASMSSVTVRGLRPFRAGDREHAPERIGHLAFTAERVPVARAHPIGHEHIDLVFQGPDRHDATVHAHGDRPPGFHR